MKKSARRLLIVCTVFCLLASAVPSVAAHSDAAPFPHSAYFTMGDYTLHYQDIPAKGTQRGQILMIHGFLSSSVYWDALAEGLSRDGYRCVLVDVPGFGYSTRETAAVAPIARETLFAALMEALSPGGRWIVAGHSMGGGIAVNLAVQFPQQVHSLLLYAPASTGVSLQETPLTRALAGTMGTLLNPLVPVITAINPLVRLFYCIATAAPLLALCYDTARITDPLNLPDTAVSLFYMMLRADPVDFAGAARLDIPILLIWAEKEYILTAQMMEEMQRALPQAEVYSIASGHMFVESRPVETGKITRCFLQKIAA